MSESSLICMFQVRSILSFTSLKNKLTVADVCAKVDHKYLAVAVLFEV